MSSILASSIVSSPVSSATSRRIAEALDVGSFWALLFLLFLAPLPLGSNRTLFLGLLAQGLWLVMITAAWAITVGGRSPWAYLSPARGPLVALCSYAAVLVAQALAGPSGTWFYSADTFQTQRYLLATLTYLAAFMAVLLLARDARRQRVLGLSLLASGVLQAFLAIGLLSVKAKYQLFYNEVAHDEQALGTFLNRNHLASYLYLSLSVGVGLLIAGLGPDSSRRTSWRVKMAAILGFVMSPRMLVRLMLVVMVIALVMTRSRMGNAAFFAAVSLMGLVVICRFPESRKTTVLLVGTLLIVDLLVVGQWVGLERVVQRIEGTALERADLGREESLEARTEPGRYTVPMVLERPWFGYGGGTYFTEFPRFKPAEMQHRKLYFDHAHNDYAEIAADTGSVGLVLLAAVVLLTARRALTLLRPHRSRAAKAAGGAGLMAILCLLLHSTVEFSLQIPAIAFNFMLIAGLVWAAPLRSRDVALEFPSS